MYIRRINNFCFFQQKVFDPSNNFQSYREVFTNRAIKHLRQNSAENQSSVTEGSTRFRYSMMSSSDNSSESSLQPTDSGIECDGNDVTVTSPFINLKSNVLIPFMVLLVKDVYFLNHSIPTVRKDGEINIEVRRKFKSKINNEFILIKFNVIEHGRKASTKSLSLS